jgi:hypothetical protein
MPTCLQVVSKQAVVPGVSPEFVSCCYLLLSSVQQKFSQLFSYAAQHASDVDGGPDFMDDAIRIER